MQQFEDLYKVDHIEVTDRKGNQKADRCLESFCLWIKDNRRQDHCISDISRIQLKQLYDIQCFHGHPRFSPPFLKTHSLPLSLNSANTILLITRFPFHIAWYMRYPKESSLICFPLIQYVLTDPMICDDCIVSFSLY